jgi:hypothetical protein
MARQAKSLLLIRNCQFAFKCDAKWEKLAPTRKPKVRFCGTCSKNVYLCDDDEELYNNVLKNRCVAINRREEMVEMLLGVVEYPSLSE